MVGRRKRHSAEFTAKVALKALKGMKTVNELGAEYGVHPTQIIQWKRQLQTGVTDIFSTRRTKEGQDHEEGKRRSTKRLDGLSMELDWLKILPASVEEKRTWVVPAQPRLSVRRQCELIGLTRSSGSYEPARASEENRVLMRLIDEQ